MMRTPQTKISGRGLVRVFLLSGLALLLLFAILLRGAIAAPPKGAQTAPAAQKGTGPQTADQAAAQAGNSNSFGQELAEASREAAGEGDQTAQFKFSPSVRWLGKVLGIGVRGAYWLAFILNFAVLALLIYLISRSRIPLMFRNRTASIRKAMEEAARASAEANRRLGEIEARLSRLDHEIAAMQQQAEKEAGSEEEKLRLAAAQDARRMVGAAEQEIAAAATMARRELRAYAAELSVALAEKRIQIDQDTDAALVRGFAEQLSNGAGPRSNGGKDRR